MSDSQNASITTITLIRLPSRRRWWALTQMASAPGTLLQMPGLGFGKLMGSGQGIGFSIKPNLHVWAVIANWESHDAFLHWLSGEWLAQYRRHAHEVFTVLQYPVRAHGLWDGEQPFQVEQAPPQASLRAVITRATIRPSKLLKFWSTVPATSRATAKAHGRLFSIGVGELPWVQQATWSLWESEQAMQQFAYRNSAHRKAIQRTRTLNWYSEELFARFVPYAAIGSWTSTASGAGTSVPDLSDYGVTQFADAPSPAALQGARDRLNGTTER